MTTDTHTVPILVKGGKGQFAGDPTKLCAMEMVSFLNGEAEITDYPACSHEIVSRMVQAVNDNVANEFTNLLSAENSIEVLALGKLTEGTNAATAEALQQWFAWMLREALPHSAVAREFAERFESGETDKVMYSPDDFDHVERKIYNYAGRTLDIPTVRWIDHYAPGLLVMRIGDFTVDDHNGRIKWAHKSLTKLRELMGLDAETAVQAKELVTT